MVISYHNICPHCGHVNKIDVLIDGIGGRAVVTCGECGKEYIFFVGSKKISE